MQQIGVMDTIRFEFRNCYEKRNKQLLSLQVESMNTTRDQKRLSYCDIRVYKNENIIH